MYSPKLPEDVIPRLWRLAQERHVPMTYLVRDAVVQYLQTAEGEKGGQDNQDSRTRESGTPSH